MVSRIGLGLAALGRPAYITGGRAADLPDRSIAGLRARTFSMLDAAYDAGIRYFDAARSYGLAEEFLGGARVTEAILTRSPAPNGVTAEPPGAYWVARAARAWH